MSQAKLRYLDSVLCDQSDARVGHAGAKAVSPRISKRRLLAKYGWAELCKFCGKVTFMSVSHANYSPGLLWIKLS